MLGKVKGKEMNTIDISQNIQDFKQVFENENRIIFSARFGDGKSYFLNEFMKNYDEKKNDYYFITLHPVNYVVEENRDVIEYIKRDILFQLIKDNRIYDFKEGYDKIFDAVCNVESLFKLADFAASIIPVNGLKEGYKALKGLVPTIDEKRKEQDVLHVVDDNLNGFYGKSGSISECDAFTYLIQIQKSLEQMMAKSVLIIEDLDRIDPAHLFRIMNVLSSQVDNPYYSEVPHGNKFRDKKFYRYKYSNMSFDSVKGSYHAGIDTDPWLRSFLSGINVRPSCYACSFKKQYRVTDFTIWDCFEVYQYSKEIDNDKGVTKVLVHSSKAEEIMKAIEADAYIKKEVGADKLIAGVHELTAQPKNNPRRTAFFEDLDRLSPKECFDKYFPVTFRTQMEKHIRILMLQLGIYKQFRMLVKKMVGEVKR